MLIFATKIFNFNFLFYQNKIQFFKFLHIATGHVVGTMFNRAGQEKND